MPAQRAAAVLSADRALIAQAALLPVPKASAPTEIQDTRHRGASRGLRSMVNWVPAIGSATSDLPPAELRTLRARSRDAARNYMPARAALMRCRTSIVGTGLVCRPAVDAEALGIDMKRAETINAQLRVAWERWADNPLECDLEGAHDFYGLQGLALLSALSSGDVLALTPMLRRAGGLHELKIQLIEADRMSNPHDAPDRPECINGVQIAAGAPVGYWVRNTHPGDRLDARSPAWAYYPAVGVASGRRRAIHIWNDKERPGQVRGAPFLAPILEPLKQLERYGGAELMAAVLSAMLTVFIEREGDETDETGAPVETFAGEDDTIALGPGAVYELDPGLKVNTMNPARPNANFEPFFLAIMKQMGAALELPLDVLLLQFDKSYSAARAAMLEAWRMFLCRRWQLTQQFCQPVYALFVDEQVAAGRLDLPGYGDPARRHAWTRALWIGPARGSMDEEKEARAAETRIRIGVSNEVMETAAMNGEDWNTVRAQRVREIQQHRADGTWPQPKPSPPAPGKDDDSS